MIINIYCFRCGKYIDAEIEEYYVFISKTKTDGNEPYCTKCYQQDVEEMKELDPFVPPLYMQNYIRMNKDD